jgi:N-acetylneuraminate synthase
MGNLNALMKMVERAKTAGCDYIKMQKKDVESFYSKEKLDALYTSPYGKTYREYRSMFEFNVEDYDRFNSYCRELDVRWFSTVQDIPSLYFMLRYDLPFYKIASCNLKNRDLLVETAKVVPRDTGIVMSVAGSTLQEIENSLELFADHQVHLLHCVAEYPCPSRSLRLGNISVLEDHFGCTNVAIGYSGHERGFIPTVAAVDLGAVMVERHFCLSRFSFVHHIECSLEPHEFEELANVIRRGDDLKATYATLPDSAFSTAFGMTDSERRFLIEGTYSVRSTGQFRSE